MTGLIGLLVSLIILGLVLLLLWWAISQIPAPQPIATVIRVIFALICVLAVLGLLFGSYSFPVLGHFNLR